MARAKWTKESVDYLREVSKGRMSPEITEMVNKRFGLDLRVSQVIAAKNRYKIKSFSHYGEYRKIFTYEIKQFIQENHKGISVEVMCQLINNKFKTNFTVTQIKNHYDDHDITNGRDTRFQPGQDHFMWKKIGEEKVDVRGRTYVKVRNTGKTWKLKSHVVWEETHGEIPEGKILMYLDRDERNWQLENLILVDHGTKNSASLRGLLVDDAPEINEATLNLTKLELKIRELERIDER